jgi:hypothetical protein
VTAPGKWARLVEAALAVAANPRASNLVWSELTEALAALTPADVALADGAEALAEATEDAEGLLEHVPDCPAWNGAGPCDCPVEPVRAALAKAGRA